MPWRDPAGSGGCWKKQKKAAMESRGGEYISRSTQYIGIGPGAHSRFFPLESDTRESRVQCLDPKLWQKMVERNGHGTQLRRKQSQFEILSELLATSLRTTKGIHPNRLKITSFKNHMACIRIHIFIS